MWPFNHEPKKEEIESAVESARKEMEPNALDVIEDIEPGSFAFGNLLCFGPGGLFVDPSEIAVLQVHPSNPRIILRNGTVVTLNNHGAISIAKIIMQQMKGRRT